MSEVKRAYKHYRLELIREHPAYYKQFKDWVDELIRPGKNLKF